jgi:hypothetical protein
MRHIGRIITTTKIEGISEFIDVTKDSSTIVNNEAKIPTLIIGYKNAQNICGDLKVTEKKIGNNLWWTFSKRERRIDYEPDLNKFLAEVFNFLMKSFKYEYLDPITCDDEELSKFSSEVFESNRMRVIYVTDTMYYVFCPHSKKTFGVSKDVLRFKYGEDYDFIGQFKNYGMYRVIDSDTFSDTKIAKTKFVSPLLYYLMTF